MLIFTKSIIAKLAANGAAGAIKHTDFKPVIKVFNPCGGATWLLTESTPGDPDRLFGLCDLGLGCVELGYVSRNELETVRGRLGLRMERDRFFKADKKLSEYHTDAMSKGRIDA
jgi:hypothetical protein